MSEVKGLSFDGALLSQSELKKLEARPLGIKYTPDGEVIVRQLEAGVIVDGPLEVEELGPLPPKFGTVHAELLSDIYSAVDQIKEIAGRTLPLTRGELISQFGRSKEVLSELVEMGFVKDEKVAVLNSGGNKTGIRKIIFFTPQGRAYVRNYLDPRYGLPA